MVSPNKAGGRRAFLSEIIDRVCGDGAEAQIKILEGISRGVCVDPHIPGSFVRVSADTMFHAALWIVEQRHGKAKQSVDVDLSGQIDHSVGPDLSRYSPRELEALELLLEKGYSTELVEGEVTTPPKLMPDLMPLLTDLQIDQNPRPTPDSPIRKVPTPGFD